MVFEYKIPEKFLPLVYEQIWEASPKHKGDLLTYSKLSRHEYKAIKSYIPANVETVMELGCGLGRGSIYLNYRFIKEGRDTCSINWILVDRQGHSENNTGAFQPKKDEFYNDLLLTEEFCEVNGLDGIMTFDTEKDDWNGLKNLPVDFMFSFCSFGMHVPIERYIDRLLSVATDDVTMIFGTRHAGYNGESFTDNFKEVIFLPQPQVPPFPIEHWHILRGKK